MYSQHGGRVAKRLVMFSDISDDKWLSTTQLIESTEDLWACDVSVDELFGASQQFDVSSLYDDDAEQQQSATTSSKRFAEPLSAEDLHVVQHRRFPLISWPTFVLLAPALCLECDNGSEILSVARRGRFVFRWLAC